MPCVIASAASPRSQSRTSSGRGPRVPPSALVGRRVHVRARRRERGSPPRASSAPAAARAAAARRRRRPDDQSGRASHDAREACPTHLGAAPVRARVDAGRARARSTTTPMLVARVGGQAGGASPATPSPLSPASKAGGPQHLRRRHGARRGRTSFGDRRSGPRVIRATSPRPRRTPDGSRPARTPWSASIMVAGTASRPRSRSAT